MTKDWVHGVGHSPVCQILLQIVVSTVTRSSPPAWMLSTPADFPFFNDCTATSTSLRRMGWPSSVCIWGQFSTDGSPLALWVYSSGQYSVHPFFHTTLWLMMLYYHTTGLVTKVSPVEKILSRWTVTDIWNLCCDLDLEHNFLSKDNSTYAIKPSLITKVSQFRRHSRKSKFDHMKPSLWPWPWRQQNSLFTPAHDDALLYQI